MQVLLLLLFFRLLFAIISLFYISLFKYLILLDKLYALPNIFQYQTCGLSLVQFVTLLFYSGFRQKKIVWFYFLWYQFLFIIRLSLSAFVFFFLVFSIFQCSIYFHYELRTFLLLLFLIANSIQSLNVECWINLKNWKMEIYFHHIIH